jgi:thiol-disulfide isomerase/thioredoxin
VRSFPFAVTAIICALLASACGGSSIAEAPASGADSSLSQTTSPPDSSSTLDGEETAAVLVSGDPLPSTEEGGIVSDPAIDSAVGAIAPTLSGTNFNGSEVTIGPDGRAKVVYLVAHWCSHCQTEVRLISELVADGELPPELDLYALSVAVRDDADNYPPSTWLADFPGTVMRDSSDNDGALASGIGGIPYALYLDGENTVMSRSIGSLSKEQILAQWRSLVP